MQKPYSFVQNLKNSFSIFKDHYEEIVTPMHLRPVELENIEGMINYVNPSFGNAYTTPKEAAKKHDSKKDDPKVTFVFLLRPAVITVSFQ